MAWSQYFLHLQVLLPIVSIYIPTTPYKYAKKIFSETSGKSSYSTLNFGITPRQEVVWPWPSNLSGMFIINKIFLRSQGFQKRHLRWKILNQNGVISKNSLIRSWPWKLGQGQKFDVVEIGCLRQVPYPKVIFEKSKVSEIEPHMTKKKKKKKKKKNFLDGGFALHGS